jgi:bacterioferritin-associated ferredoxin
LSRFGRFATIAQLTIIRIIPKFEAFDWSTETPMYVCICNGYRDAEIRDVARSGVQCARAAYETLGAGPRCGQCLEFAQTLIDEQHGRCAADTTRVSELQAAE